MKLREIAHSRTGDKGAIYTISVIAYDPRDYPRLERLVTTDRVRAHLVDFVSGDVVRYSLPHLGALNFVVEGRGGGVTRTLALDAHGKSLSSALLAMELPDEVDLEPRAGRFLEEAIALAREARAAGNHPFGALLVVDAAVVLRAQNTVKTGGNVTAHAETNLVDLAIRTLPPDVIRRSVLYSSCEPCAMCVGKMYWAGIRSLVFALSAKELAAMAGGDFLMPCRELFSRAAERVEIVGPVPIPGAREVHAGYWEAL